MRLHVGLITMAAIHACGAGCQAEGHDFSSDAGPVEISAPPPVSCAEILARDPGAPSGVYAITPHSSRNPQPFNVYCDMRSDGGGWTLVLMSKSTGAAFAFAANHWTSATTLNLDLTDPGVDEDMKSQAFNTVSFKTIRFCLGTLTNCITDAQSSACALSLFAGPEVPTSSADSAASMRDAIMAWDPAPNSTYDFEPNCNISGYNVVSVQSGYGRCRFGLIMNNEPDCDTPDDAIGFGCSSDAMSAAVSAGSLSLDDKGTTTLLSRRGWVFVR